ncbi:ferredoxin--NADP reductase [Lysobacter korlensis]|uniref:Ferredoxin--NADP reductase n=1 Tax=Lysobacter korlensis TaxID=553636 RepID=A0ABV6S3F0_9GAMM
MTTATATNDSRAGTPAQADAGRPSALVMPGRAPVAPGWVFPALDRLTGARTARVAAIDTLAPGTVRLRIERPSGYSFTAGQFALLRVATPSGPDLRPLSLAGSPESELLEFATRVGASAFKQTVFGLERGDEVKVSRPMGGLRYDPGRPAVLIAGGTGITPLRSLLLSNAALSSPAPMQLLFSNRHWQWIPFRDELAEQERARENLHITWVQTSPVGTSRGANIHHGRITPELLRSRLEQLPDAVFYVGGSAAMTAEITGILRGLGVARGRIRSARQGRR